MKDSLFEMLLTLFEKTLTQLKETHQPTHHTNAGEHNTPSTLPVSEPKAGPELECVKVASTQSTRVFTRDEQMKLTKASYQFLMRMSAYGILDAGVFEVILNRLTFSESRFVSLQETKWTIRNTLAENLDAEQLAFLDLVLYQKEDGLSLH